MFKEIKHPAAYAEISEAKSKHVLRFVGFCFIDFRIERSVKDEEADVPSLADSAYAWKKSVAFVVNSNVHVATATLSRERADNKGQSFTLCGPFIKNE